MIADPVEKKNKLLEELESKKITLDQLNTECAYWFLDCFEDMKPLEYPFIPEIYQDYLRMFDSDKKKMPKEFWTHPLVKGYLDQKYHAKEQNMAHLYNLRRFSKYIPIEDFASKNRYQVKINDFEYFFQNNT